MKPLPHRNPGIPPAGRSIAFIILSALILSLGACSSTHPLSERIESKYSSKKRKLYISCIRTGGPTTCPLPVRVTTRDYAVMVSSIFSLKGTKYRYGGNGPEGFDCSGFVQHLYSKAFRLLLPRRSEDIALLGSIIHRERLQQGDLVFFSSNGDSVDHVGVFIGEGRFAHASTSAGVTLSSLKQPWYDSRFVFGSRIVTVGKDSDDAESVSSLSFE